MINQNINMRKGSFQHYTFTFLRKISVKLGSGNKKIEKICLFVCFFISNCKFLVQYNYEKSLSRGVFFFLSFQGKCSCLHFSYWNKIVREEKYIYIAQIRQMWFSITPPECLLLVCWLAWKDVAIHHFLFHQKKVQLIWAQHTFAF